MIIQVSFESKWWTVTKCNMNSASSSLKSFSVTCASRAAFVADSCEDSVSSQLSHTQTPQTIYCGMLNSYWTSVLLVELKSSSSSQHWFHSPSQLSGHPAIQPSRRPVSLFFFFFFWEHFRWVFGCEWALGMRFEEDYQGPESCLEASCAFQQSCHFPGCIRLWNIWCVTLSLSFLSLCLSLIR